MRFNHIQPSTRHIFPLVLATVSALGASAGLPAGTFTTESRLSKGTWVKVGVADNGVCRISYDELKEMGFAEPSKVAVFGRGGAPAERNFTDSDGNVIYTDDLPAVSTMHRGDALYFYAISPSCTEYTDKGVNRKAINVYTDKAYYFLSDSQSDSRIMEEASADGAEYGNGVYDKGIAYQIFEEENINVLASGEDYFSWDLAAAPGRAMTLDYDIPGAVAGGKLTVALRGAAKISGPENLYVSLTSEGVTTDAGKVNFYNLSPDAAYSFSTSDGSPVYLSSTIPGATGKLNLSLEQSARSSFAAVDYIALGAERTLSFQPGEGSYEVYIPDYAPSAGQIAIGSAPVDLVVWYVEDSNTAVLLPHTTDTDGTALAAGPAEATPDGKLVAFSASAALQGIEGYSAVENQNIHSLAAEDPAAMLIITTDELKASADKLAEIHRLYQNEKVVAVTSEQIINEFSQGTPDPMAYRAFARMLYDADNADNRTFANVLFIGPMRVDHRGVISKKPDYPTLICKQSEAGNSLITSFTTLDFYGQMKDYYGPDKSGANYFKRGQELAVAIIPADTPAVADLYTGKVAAWLNDNTVPYWFDNVIGTADGSNKNEHQDGCELLVKAWESIDKSFTHNKLYNNCYPNTQIHPSFLKMLDRGSLWVNYLGHASNLGLNTLLWDSGDFKYLRNEHMPFMLLGGCSIASFDQGVRGSGEEMILSTPYGSLGAMVSNRSTLSTSNCVLMMDIIYASLCEQPFGPNASKSLLRTPRTFGEFIRMAMDVNTRQNSNKLAYVLMCDPALQSLMPTASIDLTVKGQDKDNATALPGSKLSLSGEIKDRDGKTESDFNGTAVFKIYGAPYTAKTFKNGDSPSVDVEHDNRLLLTVPYEVKDGKLSGSLPLPANIGGKGDKITLRMTAFDPQTRRTATANMAFTVLPFSEEGSESDDEAPVIESLYVGHTGFQSGDAVAPNATLYAIITDNTAVCTGSFDGKEGLSVTIDGRRSDSNVAQNATLSEEGRRLTLRYTLPDLTYGMHTATVRASDPSGNVSVSTIQFNVQSASPSATKAETESTVVRDKAEITLSTGADAGYTVETATLIIVDEHGRIVRSSSIEGESAEWDVCDSEGKRVAPGTYYAVCRYVTATGAAGVTEPVRLVVIRASQINP